MASTAIPAQGPASAPVPSSFTTSATNCLSKLDPRQYIKQENLTENSVKLLVITGIAILIFALTLANPSAGYAFLAVASVGAFFAIAGLIYSAVKHCQSQKVPATPLAPIPHSADPDLLKND